MNVIHTSKRTLFSDGLLQSERRIMNGVNQLTVYSIFLTSCNMLEDDFSVHRTETHRLFAVIALSRLKLISELTLSLQVEDIKFDYF